MGADVKLLDPEFQEKYVKLLKSCEEKGFKLVPFFTLRDPQLQAKLWRQSRPWPQIEAAIRMLLSNDAPWLAKLLEGVGPQYGRWATNSLPGMSWHQYGMAGDAFVLDQANGRAIWNANHDGYRIYARQAVGLGLVPGYYWRRRDAVHVQGVQERVRDRHNWAEIERIMKERFDGGDTIAKEEKPSTIDPGEPGKAKQEVVEGVHSPPEEPKKPKPKAPTKKKGDKKKESE